MMILPLKKNQTKGSVNTPACRARFLSLQASSPAGDSLFHFLCPPARNVGSCRTLNIAISVCPACDFIGSVEQFPRMSAVVNYYLCRRCGHVWATRKNDPSIIDHFRPMAKARVL